MKIVSVEWGQHGAPPEAVIDALGESALAVAILEALMEDPELRAKAERLLSQEKAEARRPPRG